MKKLVAMLLALAMLLSISAIAEAPEGYPEVVPGVDYEGKTIYIYAWYDQKRAEEPTEEEQARYDYEDWIMEGKLSERHFEIGHFIQRRCKKAIQPHQ